MSAAPDQDRLRLTLGEGIYTVPETCRILRPSMTSRKVHYWLDTGLLGEPLRKGGRGVPTLLTFEQALKIRTLQRLRDELNFSLQNIRVSLEALLKALTSPQWQQLTFVRGVSGRLVVHREGHTPIALPTLQAVLDHALPELNEFIGQVRRQWEIRQLDIDGYPTLVSDAAVLGGAPIIEGTRVETAFVANLAVELTVGEIRELFPYVEETAIIEAAKFEGVELLAA